MISGKPLFAVSDCQFSGRMTNELFCSARATNNPAGRDYQDKNIVTKLDTADALQFMLAHNFCNPHQLVRDNRKIELRKDFFRRYFEQTDVYLVNNTGTPQATQTEIRANLSVKK